MSEPSAGRVSLAEIFQTFLVIGATSFGGGVVAYGLLAFSLGVRYLKVVDHQVVEEHVVEPAQAQTAAAD